MGTGTRNKILLNKNRKAQEGGSRLSAFVHERRLPLSERSRSDLLRLEEIMKGTLTKEATIYITEVDLDRLRKLIDLSSNSQLSWNKPYLQKLADELERAEVVGP